MNKFTFEVTNDNFQEQVLQADLPVLVDFGADWCPPCKMLDPIVEQLAQKYQGKLSVAKLDGDNSPQFTEIYDVYGFPTLILFRGGQPIHRIVGFKTQDRIEAELAPHLQPQPSTK
ncbi:MAG: thioredoxin [Chloroflexota bacterium]